MERLSAVTSGIKEIRAALDKAKENGWRGVRTILFVDEVHRFNKSQQDVFLPHIEDGTITFIGATTENPSFELNNALLSRARVYLLKRLEEQDILAMIDQAMQDARGLNDPSLRFAPGAKEALAKAVDGDGRKSLNYLELLADMAEADSSGARVIDSTLLAAVVGSTWRALTRAAITSTTSSRRCTSPFAARHRMRPSTGMPAW